MSELTGAKGNRREALQHHEKPRQWAESRCQIKAPFPRLIFGIKAVSCLDLNKTLYSRDDAIVPGETAHIEGTGATHVQRS